MIIESLSGHRQLEFRSTTWCWSLPHRQEHLAKIRWFETNSIALEGDHAVHCHHNDDSQCNDRCVVVTASNDGHAGRILMRVEGHVVPMVLTV